MHSIQQYQQFVLEYLKSEQHDKEPRNLYEPVTYILGLGGKRIRPVLTLMSAEIFDASYKEALPAALAVEVFHNFSLIHDDIMDNAPLRRGKVTVHEKWNHNIGILSGDAMLVMAYKELAKCKPEHLQALLNLFNQTAIGVCEGQQLDMNFETMNEVSIDSYVKMITLKTAVLLGCSLQMGAIIAGSNLETQEHIYNFGKEIGIAFQLKDDILDVYGNIDKVGKQSGGDIISNKKTFLLLKSLELANPSQRKELDSWIAKTDFDKSEKVNAVKSIYNQLGIFELSEAEVNRHYESALKNLEWITCDASKKADLLHFAEALMGREH
jgi:geranylgeranyl diphosphate synthase type II